MVHTHTQDTRFTFLVLHFYGLSTLTPTDFTETAIISGEGPVQSIPLAGLQMQQSDAALTPEGVPTGANSSVMAARALLQQASERDPLGLADSAYVREVRADPGKVQLGSGAFDPRTFLARVHAETALEQLQGPGREHLCQEIETRDSLVKDLVRQNFAQFVNAKNSIDAVYDDMQDRALVKTQGQQQAGSGATAKAMQEINAVYGQALQVFQPLVNRTEAEAAIKRRLDFIARYKSLVFGVAKRLEEAAQSGDFATAVHDYRRGRALLAELKGTVASGKEQEALRRYWKGQVEPQADRVRDVLRKQLIGDEAGWGRSFENDFARTISLLRIFGVAGSEPSSASDPLALWVADYSRRLLADLEQLQVSTFVALDTVINTWKDDKDEAGTEELEGSLTRSILSLLVLSTPGNRIALSESLPKLDFVCVALWAERQVFFDGTAMILNRMLSVVSEAAEGSKVNWTDYLASFKARLPKYIEDLVMLSSTTSGPVVESAVVSLWGSCKGLLTLSTPLYNRHGPSSNGSVSKTIEQVLMASAQILLRTCWTSTAALEMRRIPRWQDWAIDAADCSTAVMRAAEKLLLHLIEETGRIVRMLSKVH